MEQSLEVLCDSFHSFYILGVQIVKKINDYGEKKNPWVLSN